ncbi:hypothetical protein WKH79_02225 [Qipengyuania sp. GPGPB31]|uniref:hypothetical protein n=1 Tax=Qipengyuania sp. GPGPB31 TaxID=3023518 RepID=UPI003134511C
MEALKLSSVVALGVLPACGSAGDGAAPPTEEATDTIETAQADPNSRSTAERIGQDDGSSFDRDMSYHFSQDDRGPALSFGVPRTDDIALNLRCPPGASAKTVLVSFNRPPDLVARRPDTITLKAGGASQQLTIETRETRLGTTVEVAAAPDGPVMQAYRRGATLNASYSEETIGIPSRAEDAEIEKFFDACLAET